MSVTLAEKTSSTGPHHSGDNRQERSVMQMVSCVIRPESFEAVKEALDKLQIIGGMTVTDVRGFGRQKGQVEHYRGGEYTIRFIPKIKLEVVVSSEDVEQVIAAIGKAARTGQVGDGKIFVLDLRDAMRIRTGERGRTAL